MTFTHYADKLALAILYQASIDWQHQTSKGDYDPDLINFYNSTWFEDLCYLVDLHPDGIRCQLNIPSDPEKQSNDSPHASE